MLLVSACLSMSYMMLPPRLPPSFKISHHDDNDSEWSVAIIDFVSMRDVLNQWKYIHTNRKQTTHDIDHLLYFPDYDYFPMCYSISKDNVIRCVFQLHAVPPFALCGVCVAPDADEVWTFLPRFFTDNCEIDWKKINQQPRWYLSLSYIKSESN